MENTPLYLTFAATALLASATLALAGLKAFSGWLALKHAELALVRNAPEHSPSTSNRIELADLKERLRKLEAIAAGVEY